MMDKKTKLGLIGVAGLFIFFIGFRVFYQKGGKLLADLYPWNWVALAVILGLLWLFASKMTKKGPPSDGDDNQ